MVMETGQSRLSHDLGSRASRFTTMGLFCPGGGRMIEIRIDNLKNMKEFRDVLEQISQLEVIGDIHMKIHQFEYVFRQDEEE
jgi:hypothetical protein